MSGNPIVGTWRLVSFEIRSKDDKVIYPFGDNPVGYLIYGEDGFMSVSIMKAKRSKCDAVVLSLASLDEKVEAAESYLSYSGRYEIKKNVIIHHVELSLFSNWIGMPQKRILELKGNELSLTSLPFFLYGVEHTSHLIWERV